jgi:hypothetical protein
MGWKDETFFLPEFYFSATHFAKAAMNRFMIESEEPLTPHI